MARVLVTGSADGLGLMADLERNLGLALTGKRVLIMGAGGAVRGVLGPLLERELGECVIANRTPDRARHRPPIPGGADAAPRHPAPGGPHGRMAADISRPPGPGPHPAPLASERPEVPGDYGITSQDQAD